MKHPGQLLFRRFKYFPPKYSLLDYCYPNFTLRRQGGGKEYNDRTHMPHKPQLLHRCPHFQCSLIQSNFISNNNKMHSYFNFGSFLPYNRDTVSSLIIFSSLQSWEYVVHLPFKCNTQVPTELAFTHLVP